MPMGMSYPPGRVGIPPSAGRNLIGSPAPLAQPRTDLTNGQWPDVRGTLPGDDILTGNKQA